MIAQCGIFQKAKQENPTLSPTQRLKNDIVYKVDLGTETVA